MIKRCAAAILVTLLAGPEVQAQTKSPSSPAAPEPGDRSLTFDWPVDATVRVRARSERPGGSLTVEFDLTTMVDGERNTLRIRRGGLQMVAYGDEPVTEEQRAKIAATELSLSLIPDLIVSKASGRLLNIESHEAFVKRTRDAVKEAVRAKRITPDEALALAKENSDLTAYEKAAERVQQQWHEWIGRVVALNFHSQSKDSFEGEISLSTGDVVKGKYEVSHAQPTVGDPEHVELRIHFEASGPKLAIAALRWRERLFGSESREFEQVDLAVEETTTIRTRPETLQPKHIETRRTSTVTVGEETRTFVEVQEWTFTW